MAIENLPTDRSGRIVITERELFLGSCIPAYSSEGRGGQPEAREVTEARRLPSPPPRGFFPADDVLSAAAGWPCDPLTLPGALGDSGSAGGWSIEELGRQSAPGGRGGLLGTGLAEKSADGSLTSPQWPYAHDCPACFGGFIFGGEPRTGERGAST